jgi:hypothetical protein
MGMAFGDGDPCASHGACWDALTDEARLQLGDRHHFGSGKSYPSLLGVTAASRRRRLPRCRRAASKEIVCPASTGSACNNEFWRVLRRIGGRAVAVRHVVPLAHANDGRRDAFALSGAASTSIKKIASSHDVLLISISPFLRPCNVRYSTINRAVVGSKSAGPRTMRMAENSGCASLAR